MAPDPAFLFNIAQAYRQANECSKAAEYYRQFVGALRNPPNLDKVQKLIAEMDACAAKQAAAAQPDKPADNPDKPADKPDKPVDNPDKPADKTGTLAQLADMPPDKPDVVTRDASVPHSGHGRRVAGIVVGSIGAAFVATSVVFWLSERSVNDKSDHVCAGCSQWQPQFNSRLADLEARGTRDAHMGIATGSIGAAALIAGIVVYATGHETETYAVVPTRGGATATVGFAF
jgi:hypothetical protein